MKKILAVVLCAVMVVMTFSLAFGFMTTAANATVAYSFSGSNAADRGFAQGSITVSAGAGNGGTYYLYWADDAKILSGYSAIGYVTVAASGSASIAMPEYSAIPADATKVAAYLTEAADAAPVAGAAAVYDIPQSKQIGHRSSDKLYSFASYSDFHISADKDGSSQNYPYDEAHERAAWQVAAAHDVDFVVTTGDHINNQRNDSNGGNNDFYADEWNTYLRILADSDYTGPVYEAVGNHELWNYDTEQSYTGMDWQTGYNYFVATTGLSGNTADVNSGKAYFEITEPTTGDHFLFMALEGGFYTDRVNEFTDAQLNWLDQKLGQYENDGKNTFILEHANFYKWGAGDQLDNPIYDIPLKDTNSATSKLKNILTKHKDAVLINGHTHFKLERQLNYSTNNGTSVTMIHNSAVGAVRDITNRTTRVNDKSEELTEGYIVEVYDNATIFYGINLYYDEILPMCTYIVSQSTSAIDRPSSTEASTETEKPTETQKPTETEKPSEPESTAPSETQTPSEPESTAPSETQPAFIWGDVDGNDILEITDATWIQQHLADLRQLSDEQIARSLVDGEPFINVLDATYIQRRLALLIDRFPVEEKTAELAPVAADIEIAEEAALAELEAAGADISTLRSQAQSALTKYYLLASYPQYANLKKAVRENAGYDELSAAYADLDAAAKSFYPGDTIDVYFTNVDNWSNVYAYCYADRNTKNAEWPGQRCTYVTTNSYGQRIYKFSVPTGKYHYIIFNNNAGSQTIDLACGITKNQGYYTDGKDTRGYLKGKQYVYK